MADELAGQLPLFDADPAPEPSGPGRSGRGQVTWSRMSDSRARVLCTECIWVIHERGVAAAPYPARARWRRSGPDGVVRLCGPHADARRRSEGS